MASDSKWMKKATPFGTLCWIYPNPGKLLKQVIMVKKTQGFFRWSQDFLKEEKVFLPDFLLKSFLLNCFSKCNLHFQSLLISWALIAENITKISDTKKLLKFNFSKLNASKATLFTWLNTNFLIRIILASAPGSKKHYPQQ